MQCAKSGSNCPSGSGEDFKISSIYFRNDLLLEKDRSLIWLKLDQWYYMWKVYHNVDKNEDNNDNDDYGQRTNFDEKSPLDLLIELMV